MEEGTHPMQRLCDKEELESQPEQKKFRLESYNDRVKYAVRAALFDPLANEASLPTKPIVIWCTHATKGRTVITSAILYWPCHQKIGEAFVNALRDKNDDKHNRLIWYIMEMATGYLSDYKAAKDSRCNNMKRYMVERFLQPDQPLSALGQFAIMDSGDGDTMPLHWSKHVSVQPIKDSELSSHLFYIHCIRDATDVESY